MKAYLCEFSWQAALLPGQLSGEQAVLSLTPRASQALEMRGVPFTESPQWCDHAQLWSRYQEFTGRTFALTSLLDDLVLDMDPRFRERGLRPFDGLHYILKICHDQITYFVHLLNALFASGPVEEVVCADTGPARFDECGLFDNQISILPGILECFQPRFGFRMTPQVGPRTISAGKTAFSFGQPLKALGRASFLGACNRARGLAARVLRSTGRAKRLLSVGCKEVDALFRHAPVPGWGLVRHGYQVNLAAGGRKWAFFEAFMRTAAGDPRIRAAMSHDGVDFSPAMLPAVAFFAGKLESLLRLEAKTRDFLDAIRPDCVVFQTLAPVYPPNMLVKHWCDQRGIPYFCWMHGGYGASWSIPGYDVVDWRLCSRHFVYGDLTRELVQDSRCMNHVLGFPAPSQVESLGSPFFQELYHGYVRPQNERKRIMLAIGNKTVPNSFYFGYNRPETEMSIWRQHRAIIKALIPFQDRFDIVVKDYPCSWDKELWRSVLKACGGDRIRYVCEEQGFPEVMRQADLHVYTWISTTFFQSLHTDADIMVFDDGDMTPMARSMLAPAIGLADTLEAFVEMLTNYLKNNEFYTQDKTALRAYCLDDKNHGERGRVFADILTTAGRSEHHARI